MELGRNIYCSLKLLRAENMLFHTVRMLHIYRIKVRAVFLTFFCCVRERIGDRIYNLQFSISIIFRSLGATKKKQKKKQNSNSFHKYILKNVQWTKYSTIKNLIPAVIIPLRVAP